MISLGRLPTRVALLAGLDVVSKTEFASLVDLQIDLVVAQSARIA